MSAPACTALYDTPLTPLITWSCVLSPQTRPHCWIHEAPFCCSCRMQCTFGRHAQPCKHLWLIVPGLNLPDLGVCQTSFILIPVNIWATWMSYSVSAFKDTQLQVTLFSMGIASQAGGRLL